jgi:hypothetical protein
MPRAVTRGRRGLTRCLRNPEGGNQVIVRADRVEACRESSAHKALEVRVEGVDVAVHPCYQPLHRCLDLSEGTPDGGRLGAGNGVLEQPPALPDEAAWRPSDLSGRLQVKEAGHSGIGHDQGELACGGDRLSAIEAIVLDLLDLVLAGPFRLFLPPDYERLYRTKRVRFGRKFIEGDSAKSLGWLLGDEIQRLLALEVERPANRDGAE